VLKKVKPDNWKFTNITDCDIISSKNANEIEESYNEFNKEL